MRPFTAPEDIGNRKRREGATMLAPRHHIISLLLILAFVATGCGSPLSAGAAAGSSVAQDGSQAEADDGAQGQREDGGGGNGGAAGAPLGGGGGGTAVGAPINIPAFTIEGALFYEQRDFVIDEIVAACGDGTQCVGIDIVVEDPTADADSDNDGVEGCTVLAGTPAQEVPRGGSITFRVAAPCGGDGSPVGSVASEEAATESVAPPPTDEHDDDITDGTQDDVSADEEQDAGIDDEGESAEPAGASEG